MAGSTQETSSATVANGQPQGKQTFAFIAMTCLFFFWGFITVLNDILIPFLKESFDLNYTQAMLVQFCFFGAYFYCLPVCWAHHRQSRLSAGHRFRLADNSIRLSFVLPFCRFPLVCSVFVCLLRASSGYHRSASCGKPLRCCARIRENRCKSLEFGASSKLLWYYRWSIGRFGIDFGRCCHRRICRANALRYARRTFGCCRAGI